MTQHGPSTQQKVRALISAMLLNLIIGSYYSYGNIYGYIAQYLKSQGNHIGEKDPLIASPILLVLQSIFTAISISVASKIGYRWTNFLGFSIVVVGNIICSYVKNFYVYVVVYASFSGIGCGLGYLMGLYITWTYFPNHKSIATGAILFCAGISASLLSPIQTKVVNPHNLDQNDPRVIANVPKLFQAQAIIFGVITVVACLMSPPPYESKVLKQKLSHKVEDDQVVRRKSGLLHRAQALGYDYTHEEDENHHIAVVNRYNLSKELVGGAGHNLLAHLNEDRMNALADEDFSEENSSSMGRDSTLIIGNVSEEDNLGSYQFLTSDGSMKESLIDSVDTQSNTKRKLSMEEIYQKSQELKEASCPSLMYGLFSPAFLMIGVMAFSSSIFNYFFNGAWKDFANYKLQNVADDQISFIITIAAVFNSIARLLIGFLIMKVSFKVIYIVVIIVQIASAFSVFYLATTYISVVIYISISMFCIGAHVTLFPTLATKVFGVNTGQKVYPFVYQCFSAAGLVQMLMYQFIGSKFLLLLQIFGAMSIVALVLAISFNEERDWTQVNIRYSDKIEFLRQKHLQKEVGKAKQNDFEEPNAKPEIQNNQVVLVYKEMEGLGKGFGL